MYSIEFSKKALKQFYQLEVGLQKNIVHVLDRIRIRPFNFVMKIVGSQYYRLRVGDYRLILDIRKEKLIIIVVYMGHRKKIYKKI